MNEIAAWVAPAATIVAAMVTAANLGARVTGWGFVVFTLGPVCWSLIGFSSGQTNLLASNGFLTAVNLIGIWRWLGRQRAYEDGGKSATRASRRSNPPALFTATGIAGMPVKLVDGIVAGKAVETLVECRSGEISYIVAARGGVGDDDETLRAIPETFVGFSCDDLTIRMTLVAFERMPPSEDGDWPANAASPQSSC